MKLEDIKFNLDLQMTNELIKYNNIKNEISNLLKENHVDKDKINELNKKLNSTRTEFIKKFRENNKNEILEYLKIKDEL